MTLDLSVGSRYGVSELIMRRLWCFDLAKPIRRRANRDNVALEVDGV